jgi:hypothetical protein
MFHPDGRPLIVRAGPPSFRRRLAQRLVGLPAAGTPTPGDRSVCEGPEPRGTPVKKSGRTEQRGSPFLCSHSLAHSERAILPVAGLRVYAAARKAV